MFYERNLEFNETNAIGSWVLEKIGTLVELKPNMKKKNEKKVYFWNHFPWFYFFPWKVLISSNTCFLGCVL